MITRKTVLILGAGASVPYGFPTGEKLRKQIITSTTEPGGEVTSVLRACGFTEKAIQNFGHAFHRSQWSSVDRFLEHRTEFLDIGKAAIAASLIPCEHPHSLFDTGDWYAYLFNVLGSGCCFEEFGKNSISFVSYNYDRSLQYYLLTALMNAYGKTSAEAAKALAHIPFVYLHGQLGTLNKNEANGRSYGMEGLTPEGVQICMQQIKIIHETEGVEPQFAHAHQLLCEAERVCFLGFGYDERNTRRLFPDEVLNSLT